MSSSHEAAETEDADESDHHLCLRCRRSIQGLENYVRHRRNKNCSGKTKKVQQESEFVGSLRLQHKRGVTNEEEEEEEEAVAAAAAAAVEAARSFRDDQVASSFEHQEGPEPVEVEGGTSYEDGGEGGGGAHRIRRPSSDQAASFMESLGLLAKDSSSLFSPRRDSGKGFLSPRYSGRGQDEVAFDEQLLIWPMSEFDNQPEAEALQQPSPKFSVASKSHQYRSKISSTKHKDRSVCSGVNNANLSLITDLRTLAMSPSQTDFLRKMDLMNVSSLGVDEAVKDQVNAPGHEALENGLNSATSETVPNSGVGTPFGGYRWKLWHPEQESDELWNDVLTQGELYNFVDAARNPEEEVQYQEPPRDPDETMEKQVSSEAPALRAKRHGISPKKFMDECFDGDDGGASYRKRRRTMGVDETLNCPMCDYRSPREHFGKHLISHYHLHHSKLPRDHPKAQQLVFDHLDDIVKLSPFRCQPCSFYCNWSKYFIAHWERAHSTSSGGRLFWCSFCEFTCVGGHKMLEHLKGDRHGEIVSAIGRVVPIVIRSIDPRICPKCGDIFRLNANLRTHLAKVHQSKESLPDHEKYECQHCENYTTLSRTALTAHVFSAHPEKRSRFHCDTCQLEFDSKKACQAHRRGAAHRSGLKKTASSVVKCDHCPESLDSLDSLRKHLRQTHPGLQRQCGLCGERFAIPQDLSAHVRRRKCSNIGIVKVGDLACSEVGCNFTSDTLDMLLYHKALAHSSAPEENSYKCFCDKSFRRRSCLLDHVRASHGDATNSHKCSYCYKTFVSSQKLARHKEVAHPSVDQKLACDKCDYWTLKPRLLALHQRRTHFTAKDCDFCGEKFTSFKRYLNHLRLHQGAKSGNRPLKRERHRCQDCDFSTLSKFDLRSHQVIHRKDRRSLFECDKDNCTFSCARRGELNRHLRRVHGGKEHQRPFACSWCKYCAVTRQHLHRHVKAVHAGVACAEAASPKFHCRLCEQYSSTTLENLRKHVLETGIHRGAKMYDCDYCASDKRFQTNSTLDFRRHVTEAHMEDFTDTVEALRYCQQYFSARSNS